jgi:hypothetical protein
MRGLMKTPYRSQGEQSRPTGGPVTLNRATLLAGMTWWGLGIAAAFGAYFAIVVHELERLI